MAVAPGKKRVLFLVSAFTGGAGGPERITGTLLRHIDRSDLDCHMATVQSGTEFLKDVPEGVTIHQLGVSRMRFAVPSILRLVRDVRPDTILSMGPYLSVLLLIARPFFPRGTRIIVCESTTPSGFIERDVSHPALWKFFYRSICHHADLIVCLSDSIHKEFRERFHVPAEMLVRIYNPLDGAAVRASVLGGSNPLSGEGPQLVGAGRLRHEKGFDLLIDAMALIHRQIPRAKLTILGQGPEEAELKQQVRDLGLDPVVDFVGFQHHPWIYMAHANLVVLPSRVEGLPNVLLEALALNVPVVATDCVETMRELQALDDRIVLAEPENPVSLAQTIVSALEQSKTPRSRGQADDGRLRLFDPVEIASQYRRLL